MVFGKCLLVCWLVVVVVLAECSINSVVPTAEYTCARVLNPRMTILIGFVEIYIRIM